MIAKGNEIKRTNILLNIDWAIYPIFKFDHSYALSSLFDLSAPVTAFQF